jgi:hypothetical protein
MGTVLFFSKFLCVESIPQTDRLGNGSYIAERKIFSYSGNRIVPFFYPSFLS